MAIEYLVAKNLEETVKIDNSLLHSSYNPSKEAERIVSNITFEFLPKFILVFEPGLGYIYPFLKEKFPKCIIGDVKVTNINSLYNFDFELPYDQNINNFNRKLFKFIPEEEIFLTEFINWDSSIKIFNEEFNSYINSIKQIVNNSKTVLITRQYFEKKWLINSCNFLKYSNNFAKLIKKITKTIVICASGPSLNKNLINLKKNRNKIFIICLSSAISVLKYHDIIPDLYFSTDGGYWANFHLRKINHNIPIVLSPESFINKQILKSSLILPIIYNDGITRSIQNVSKIKFYKGERNGTVSGTALMFALQNSTEKIYFLGLDLSSQNGYQHSQPNELELINSIKDYRIKTKETRIYPSSLPNESLDIYKKWFDQQEFNNRVFRVIEQNEKNNNINSIKDINSEEFSMVLSKLKENKENYFEIINRNTMLIINECKNYSIEISERIEEDFFKKNIFILDYISSLRNPNNCELKEKIDNEYINIINRIKRILNE